MMYFANTDSIDKLGLSVRTYNALSRAGVETISQFMKLDESLVHDIRNVGVKSLNEVNKVKEQVKLISPNEDESNITADDEMECRKLVFSLVDILPCNPAELFKVLLPKFKKWNMQKNHALFLHELVRLNIIEFLGKKPFGADLDELIGLYGTPMLSEVSATKVLDELVEAGLVSIDKKVELRQPTLRDYISGIENKKHSEMLQLRLMGKTLEEVGKICGGVTREGVRQVVKKCITRKNAFVREDKFIGIFNTYAFDREDFKQIFEIDELSYMYLYLFTGKPGLTESHLFLQDLQYPAWLRKRAEEVLFKDFFTINGKKVYKRRTDLADYVCQTYFKEEAVFDSFLEKYDELVKQLGVKDDPRFIVNRATYQNRFSEAWNVLWKYQSRFRYYDMDAYDFTSLFEGLDLGRYENVEYSTLKFFRANRELMAEYDIKDEYELHNLLRKLYAKKGDTGITFSRMPIIVFGKPDRQKQVLELLQAKAPIDVRRFCEAYEEEYGVLARTVSGGFIAELTRYRDNNGMYNLAAKPLPKTHTKRLKSLLDGDYYDFSFVLELYQAEFPDYGAEMLTSFSLKEVGFRVFSTYCIRDTFPNAVEYFRHVLTSTDYVNLSELPASLASHTSFTSEMYSLKNSFEIVEYEPQKFVNIRKLRERGINKKDLRDYCEKVEKFVKPNTHFTIKFIKTLGFSHPLQRENFDDWFFASLLAVDKKRFKYQRMGGSKIFVRGTERITMESLLKSIAQENNGMSFQDLVRFLDTRYGLVIDKYKIGTILDASELHYDRVENRIYLSGKGGS